MQTNPLCVISQQVEELCKTGSPQPLGISLVPNSTKGSESSVNFAIVSRNASSISLCLFRKEPGSNVASEVEEISLDPSKNRTGDVWHIQLDGLNDYSLLYYGWKADGLHGWEGGSRFHPKTVLVDPLSYLVMPILLPGSAKSIFLGTLGPLESPVFDWEGVSCPRHGYENLRVCEIDIEILNNNLETIVRRLSDAGINGIVLKQVMLSSKGYGPNDYAPLSYFAPNQPLLQSENGIDCSQRLKTIIKELHRASIEVLMEVQYCFTAETETLMSLKGLDVSLYFRGKGILNCGHPVVHQLILDSLRFWRQEYKMDGFVFVNSETMSQDRDGVIQDCPSLPEAIAADPILRFCKLISISGNDELMPRQGERGYPHWGVWTEYNTRFQFDFWDFLVMTTQKKLSNVATRITGSADLFSNCWDGGLPGNLAVGRRPSFGFNSPTPYSRLLMESLRNETPSVVSLRSKEASLHKTSLACALLVTICISQGVPVFPEDCLTNETLFFFAKKLIAFRKSHSNLIQPSSFETIRNLNWHGVLAGNQPDWDGVVDSSFIGYSSKDEEDNGFYAAFNASHSEVSVQAPELPLGFAWKCVVYTSVPSEEEQIQVPSHSMFNMDPQTAVIMEIVPTSG